MNNNAVSSPVLRGESSQAKILLHMRLFLFLFTFSITGLTSAQPPNVVIFLADDQGWGDLSLHGNTNLATPRTSDGTTLSYGKRRKIVIEHEVFRVLLEKSVDPLLIAGGAKRNRDQRLRFAALKNCRTVDPWQDVHEAIDWPEGGSIPTVRASSSPPASLPNRS